MNELTIHQSLLLIAERLCLFLSYVFLLLCRRPPLGLDLRAFQETSICSSYFQDTKIKSSFGYSEYLPCLLVWWSSDNRNSKLQYTMGL